VTPFLMYNSKTDPDIPLKSVMLTY